MPLIQSQDEMSELYSIFQRRRISIVRLLSFPAIRDHHIYRCFCIKRHFHLLSYFFLNSHCPFSIKTPLPSAS